MFLFNAIFCNFIDCMVKGWNISDKTNKNITTYSNIENADICRDLLSNETDSTFLNFYHDNKNHKCHIIYDDETPITGEDIIRGTDQDVFGDGHSGTLERSNLFQ